MNVIVTGAIGSGKTTAVTRAIRALQPRRVAGIRTRAIVRRGRKVALVLGAWEGEGERVFARASEGAESVGDFEVDLTVFNTFGLSVLRRAADAPLVVLDELGVLEQRATAYTEAAKALWRRQGNIIAVIQARALQFWLACLGPESPHALFDLNASDRDELPSSISARIA